MSAITFDALISGVSFDFKKGLVKIQLVATSFVSLDKLVNIGPKDESIEVTLMSPQTEFSVFPLVQKEESDETEQHIFSSETDVEGESAENDEKV